MRKVLIFGIYGLCTCQSKTKQQTQTQSFFHFLSHFPHLFSLFQCILITYTDTCLRPFESDMPNPERESWVQSRRGSSPLCCPASPPTFHLSLLLRTRAIQRSTLTFELWECSLAVLAAVKGDSSLSLPVYPSAPSSLVVVVLCSCSPGLSCGFLSWFKSLNMAKSKPILLCHPVLGNTKVVL